uniref:CHD3-type chromatin-remodeling factor PICKLE n=1 Tax=Salix viminalis TaxID=40686 RepID=A0A6N2KIW4_SALVM
MFSVQAGHDVALYITSDLIGGNATLRNKTETIYAGGVLASPMELIWEPDRNTPDLVYYHSLFQKKMGWRIQVVDGVYLICITTVYILLDIVKDSISIARGEKKSGYVAIGFGTRMVNSYALWVIDDIGVGHGSPSVHPTNENLTDIRNGIITFEFTRPLKLCSHNDQVECKNIIDPTTPLKVIWALGTKWSDENLNEKNMHFETSHRPIQVFLMRGSAEAEEDLRPVLAVHGFMMFLAWGILLPGGIMAARYLKHVKGDSWYQTHVYLQYSGLAILLLGLLFAVAELRGLYVSSAHVKFGLAAIFLACVQPVNASMRPKKPANGEEVSSKRHLWEYLHFIVGRSAIIVGIAALFSGLKHLGDRYGDVNAHGYIWALILWFAFGTMIVTYLEYQEKRRRRGSRILGRSNWVLGNLEEDDSIDLLSPARASAQKDAEHSGRMEVQLEPMNSNFDNFGAPDPLKETIYNLDESDDDADFVHGKAKKPQEKIERFVRDDARIPVSFESESLICELALMLTSKCLLPPLKAPFPSNWRCPECVSPLNDIDKLLDSEMRPTVADDSDATKLGSKQIFVKQYLVKWKGLSYLHCTWVPEKEFLKAFKSNPRLKTKVNNFNRQMASNNNSEDDFVAIRPEWTTVDRILACRGVEDEKEYLVKYKELPYDECYWEYESDVSAFQPEIERFNRIQSRSHKSSKQKSSRQDVTDSKKKSKEFQQCEHSPEFLSGGSLHPYQLEGLNFLRFSWSKQTHVILADEMGLGKTIQSIAFLASLFEEGISPHLVVAPLSTLRNWEREFATWAPQMNVVCTQNSLVILLIGKEHRVEVSLVQVMYVGSAQARAVIREYEFYYPKKHKKIKKKKSGQVVTERKQDRIKFDVLLTSYEMINLDTTSLKPINWECMIVDEGHRLKNKDSKLFISMKQYYSNHRVLLTGTPLQNNLDELFMLMHFLDAGKFASLEEFQEEFKDINQEEQISRLHKMLAPHLLRRVKKDVMKELPPKKELILRVELSSKQKEYYKAILTRNYQILTRHGGAQISLINVVMELRKLCCHPYMLEGVEPDIEDTNESFKQLVETSGKLQLLDKMMVRLKEHGHRVLIYSQFQHMLDLLEDYCTHKKWTYERIDGKVGGAERQVRIDRFNAKNSSRFCFLLSTRAGGLGINLATADTVIIYDSDWNPHADLQAMARAHRLGQTDKVMIYRLITRGTIEERMMQMTKKKMVLEHLVVGRLKAQNINQEELDDIIRYGSKELFADENDEAGKSRQIHYDDAAIHQLLDREQIGDEETSLDDEEEDGFLKAFKVANFEYIDKAEAAAEKEAQRAVMETKSTVSNSERTNYWEELLKGSYEVQKIDESNALGKGKRSRKQMVSVEEDDLAGLEDVSSDVEDDNYEAELTDGETTLSGIQTGKRPYKKKGRVDNTEPIPLMEGEGRSFRVLGFNQNQRAAFVQILMRFGAGDYDWKEFAPRLKQKTYEEVENYGRLFLAHIAEDLSDSPNFSDGVPKEGLRIQDVLIRIAVLLLIRDKARFASENPGSPLYTDDIMLRYPGLKSGKFWKQEHDSLLLHAVLKHGYGRWQAIVDDKDLRVQEIICKESNLPFIRLPVLGQAASQAQNGSTSNMDSTQAQANGTGNDVAADVAQGTTDVANQAPLYQDSSILFHFRDMQRRQVEFIKKRVLLLERGLYAEYQKEYFGGDIKANDVTSEEADCETMAADRSSLGSIEINAQLIDQLPQMESIASEEISAAACDDNPDRLALPQLYNKMCMVVEQNVHESVQISLTNQPESLKFGAGDYDWKEFAPRLKQKTYEEVENYGRLFLAHIAEDLSDSPNFSDGVPKEGLRIQDVLIRIAVLLLIRDKARFASENPGSPLYTDDIMLRYPGLKSGKFWKQEHDSLLLHAVLKHGYGRWQAIVDDKDLRVQEIICKELNLPFIRLPVLGQAASQAQNGSTSNMDSTQTQANGTGNDVAADVAQGTTDVANQAPLYQDSSILFHFRDMQRRQVEFIKKRVLLLERGLYAEYQKEYFGGDIKANEVTSEEADCETMAADRSSLGSIEINAQLIDQLPQMESISSEEISAAACDDNPDRLALPQLYNKMCMVVEQNVHESVQISLTDRPASLKLRQDLQPLKTIHEQINQILSPSQQRTPTSEQATLGSSKHVQAESQSKEAEFHSPSDQLKENDDNAAATEVVKMKDATTEPKLQGTVAVLNEELVKETSQSTSDSPPSAYPVTPPKEPTCSPGTTEKDVGMVDMNNEKDTQH